MIKLDWDLLENSIQCGKSYLASLWKNMGKFRKTDWSRNWTNWRKISSRILKSCWISSHCGRGGYYPASLLIHHSSNPLPSNLAINMKLQKKLRATFLAFGLYPTASPVAKSVPRWMLNKFWKRESSLVNLSCSIADYQNESRSRSGVSLKSSNGLLAI